MVESLAARGVQPWLKGEVIVNTDISSRQTTWRNRMGKCRSRFMTKLCEYGLVITIPAFSHVDGESPHVHITLSL